MPTNFMSVIKARVNVETKKPFSIGFIQSYFSVFYTNHEYFLHKDDDWKYLPLAPNSVTLTHLRYNKY